MPSGNSIGKCIPQNSYTAGQVASMAHTSKDTVLRWTNEGYLACGTVMMGKVRVRYYAYSQVRKAQRMAAAKGQPRLSARARKAPEPTTEKKVRKLTKKKED